MKQKPLFTVDGETLTTTLLPPVRFVVEGFIPQGLHLLAGASKIGKSWLALWLCLQVAKGEKVWDFPSRRGDVLYLCLEDNYSRIQSRLLDITDTAPGNLHFATASEKLRCGLEQQIQQFLAGHPHTVLVVIDTLQRVRGAGGDANAYEKEQESLKEKRDQLIAQLAHTQEVQDNVEQFVPLIQKYTDIQELTPYILNELIEKIVVHEKKVDEDGSKSQLVEIHYKFVGCIDLGAMLG